MGQCCCKSERPIIDCKIDNNELNISCCQKTNNIKKSIKRIFSKKKILLENEKIDDINEEKK